MSRTDIQSEGWVMRLPPRWRPYAVLMRLDRPAGWWLLLLPCWWGVVISAGGIPGMGFRAWGLMILFLMGAIVMRGAGCVINDLWDRDIDARVARTKTRPIASGAVSVRQALIFLAGLLAVGATILFSLNGTAILIGLFSMILVVTYPLMKRVTWWPQAFLGLTFNIGAVIAGAAMTGGITAPCVLLYIGGIFWTLGYDTIYAHQDREDDALIGVKSTARLFGDNSRWFVGAFYVGAGLCFLTAAILAGAGAVSLTCLILSFSHLLWQVWRWRSHSAASSLSVFRSNRDFGCLVLLCLFALPV